jgi:MOSC domain-containing protein YiiM
MRLVSVQAGSVRCVAWEGRHEETAIGKTPVTGAAHVGPGGVEGDEIGDRTGHGGPDQALLCFSADHYPLFESRFGRRLLPGSFGENLTIAGTDEAVVRVGDVYRVGSVELQVTCPRAPCSTLARHLGDPDLVPVMRAPHRAGWYARVLRPGHARAGDDVVLVAPGDAAWTIRRAAAVRDDAADVEGARDLLGVEGLGARWRAKLRARVGDA